MLGEGVLPHLTNSAGILIISDQGLSLLNASNMKNAALLRIRHPLCPELVFMQILTCSSFCSDVLDMLKHVIVAEQMELRYVFLCWGHDDILGFSREDADMHDWQKAVQRAFR